MHIAPHRLAPALFALGLAACGSSAGSASNSSTADPIRPTDAKAVLAASVAKATTGSYTATFTLNEHVTLPVGLAGSSGPLEVHLTADLRAENGQRVAMTLHNSSGVSTPQTFQTVLYDGTAYLSSDGGGSWKTLKVPAAALKGYGPGQVLQYLQAAGTVTDTGPGTVDGQHVESYHAILDPTKAASAMSSVLSSVLGGESGGRLASAITLKDGTADLAVDNAQQPVQERFNEAVLIDFSKLAGGSGPLAGATGTATVAVDGVCDFANFGTPQTVTRPTNVVGSINLPSTG